LKLKQEFCSDISSFGLPPQLAAMGGHLSHLSYSDAPNYDYLCDLLQSMQGSNKDILDFFSNINNLSLSFVSPAPGLKRKREGKEGGKERRRRRRKKEGKVGCHLNNPLTNNSYSPFLMKLEPGNSDATISANMIPCNPQPLEASEHDDDETISPLEDFPEPFVEPPYWNGERISPPSSFDLHSVPTHLEPSGIDLFSSLSMC